MHARSGGLDGCGGDCEGAGRDVGWVGVVLWVVVADLCGAGAVVELVRIGAGRGLTCVGLVLMCAELVLMCAELVADLC